MKQELAALELFYLLKELKILIGGKVEKIYQKKEDFLFQFHTSSKGKVLLRVLLPGLMYMTQSKGEYGVPAGFCMFLRKHLQGKRLESMNQKGFERIVEFDFEGRGEKVQLIIELFQPGNVIFCKEGKVISAYTYHKWKDRTIRPGEVYTYPVRDNNILEMDSKLFESVFLNSDKESIVKTLALEFGFGGVYAEEICFRAGIDKNKEKLEKTGISVLFDAISKIKSKKIYGYQYIKKEDIVDVTPFKINHYDIETKKFESYSEAIDATFSPFVAKRQEDNVKKEKETAVNRVENIISSQKKKMKEFEEEVDENTKKAEAVYQHYKEIENIISELKEARKKYSWKEIQDQLIGKKRVKKIIPKENKIIFDI